jgi:hypothetical protein
MGNNAAAGFLEKIRRGEEGGGGEGGAAPSWVFTGVQCTEEYVADAQKLQRLEMHVMGVDSLLLLDFLRVTMQLLPHTSVASASASAPPPPSASENSCDHAAARLTCD